ncbi:hypothetical protein ALC60_02766 [Trachymyrmex zeteki]|uniref:Uncharacterized protein n=1 Tax=Mycetomoellerius zeteki TaxID=64791 RepID=A0A151XD93_9HYME|nr:hypothetical protein ALC60_02766 [Trachymyrmex zeteki]
MRGVAGTGWRWWSFHLFAHTIDSVIKRCTNSYWVFRKRDCAN